MKVSSITQGESVAFYSPPSGVCLKTCGNSLSAPALLGLEEVRGAGSGMFWDVLGLQCVLSTAEVSHACGTGWVLTPRCAAAGRAHLCREHQQQGSCQVFPQLPAGAADGDVCHPAAVLVPAKLIISLALIGRRMTFSTLQDSQY